MVRHFGKIKNTITLYCCNCGKKIKTEHVWLLQPDKWDITSYCDIPECYKSYCHY